MKNGIPSEKYYALLEWKDEHKKEWEEFSFKHKVKRLCDCNVHLLYVLYDNYLNK